MLWHHFAIRLALALILGAFIGAERQWRQRMAVLRTNALVAAGAGLFVMLSALAARPDDSFRIAGQVVSGIGFLGAGVILRNGLNITGLNTVATLWCSAAISAPRQQLVRRSKASILPAELPSSRAATPVSVWKRRALSRKPVQR